jgi:hypothetical protein
MSGVTWITSVIQKRLMNVTTDTGVKLVHELKVKQLAV